MNKWKFSRTWSFVTKPQSRSSSGSLRAQTTSTIYPLSLCWHPLLQMAWHHISASSLMIFKCVCLRVCVNLYVCIRVHVCVCMCMHMCGCGCVYKGECLFYECACACGLWRTEGVTGPPKAGVIGNLDCQTDIGSRNQTGVLWKSVMGS